LSFGSAHRTFVAEWYCLNLEQVDIQDNRLPILHLSFQYLSSAISMVNLLVISKMDADLLIAHLIVKLVIIFQANELASDFDVEITRVSWFDKPNCSGGARNLFLFCPSSNVVGPFPAIHLP